MTPWLVYPNTYQTEAVVLILQLWNNISRVTQGGLHKVQLAVVRCDCCSSCAAVRPLTAGYCAPATAHRCRRAPPGRDGWKTTSCRITPNFFLRTSYINASFDPFSSLPVMQVLGRYFYGIDATFLMQFVTFQYYLTHFFSYC